MLEASNAGLQNTQERGTWERRGCWLSSRDAGALIEGLGPTALSLQPYQDCPLLIPEDLKVKTWP